MRIERRIKRLQTPKTVLNDQRTRATTIDSRHLCLPDSTHPGYIKADLMHNGNEIFKISTLLRAMGLSLETHRAAHNETIRHRGLVVMLLMDIHSYE